MITGWVMFLILIVVNTAIYVGIDMAFENDFWREDEKRNPQLSVQPRTSSGKPEQQLTMDQA